MLLAPLLLAAASALAQTPSADEIAENSQQAFHYAGRDMTARVVMTLVTAGGEQRVRDLSMLRRNGEAGRPPCCPLDSGHCKIFTTTRLLPAPQISCGADS